MDFQNRGSQQHPAAAAPQKTKAPRRQRGKGIKILSAVLLVAVALLIAAIPLFIATSDNSSESSLLEKDKYQAVFLNGGQVYFGKIDDIGKDTLTLSNIYYLRVNDQVQPDANAGQTAQQDISLAKLGCELHGPDDLMVIYRSQVSFWENLKQDGQVTKAIDEFVSQNPDGQTCAQPAQNNQ